MKRITNPNRYMQFMECSCEGENYGRICAQLEVVYKVYTELGLDEKCVGVDTGAAE